MLNGDDFPGLIAGRYRPVRMLARGGMGAVHLVEHAHTGERLALKLLTLPARLPEVALERFKREARALAKIKSENVVRVIDADTAPEMQGAPFLVMEYLEGVDLETLTLGTPQTTANVLEWLGQVGRGLDRAHALGIVHRDLKPENIFLTHRDDGTPLVKLLDFGIAKVTGEEASTTQTGAVLGTPLYMSYEQASGATGDVGPATDVWAIGMITFRLLTGVPYWQSDVIARILAAIVYEPIVAPSRLGCELGGAFDAWFLRSCDRDPAARFGSVTAQYEGLVAALHDAPDITPKPCASAVRDPIWSAETMAEDAVDGEAPPRSVATLPPAPSMPRVTVPPMRLPPAPSLQATVNEVVPVAGRAGGPRKGFMTATAVALWAAVGAVSFLTARDAFWHRAASAPAASTPAEPLPPIATSASALPGTPAPTAQASAAPSSGRGLRPSRRVLGAGMVRRPSNAAPARDPDAIDLNER